MDVLRTRNKSALPLTLHQTWPFILVVVLQATLAGGSICVLSTVRAFVAGESLWTKGQKDAIYHLDHYATNGDARSYEAFLTALSVPQGDRASRLALEQPIPDIAGAREGFLQGGNHPDDIDGLIWLLRYFREWDIVRKPVEQWLVGDEYLHQLRELSQEIHAITAVGIVDSATRQNWRNRIRDINADVTPAARLFSDQLGHSSRRIVALLMWINGGAALLLILITLVHNHKLLMQRQRVEEVLGAERERAHTTLTAIGDGVITTDTQGRVVYVNPATELLLARQAAQVVGQPLSAVLAFNDEVQLPGTQEFLERVLYGAEAQRNGRTRNLLRHDASTIPVKVMGSPIHNQGVLTGAVLVLHDVTREQHYVEQLSWQASHDALTGLVNRREFERRLEVLLSRPRVAAHEGALLYVDLDQFKIINDTCGHQAGDEVLREVCRMLQSHLREGDTLARLGGDEFGILLKDCPIGPASRIAEQLRQSAQELRVTWGRRQLSTGLSLGLVQLTPELNTLQEVLRVADMACYRAKESGRNKVFVYQATDTEMSRREGDMDWVRRIRLALDQDRFCLYAQEITPLQASHEDGLHVELLLRLRDEDGQLVPPGSFIPAAEHYGMMPAIDRWVVHHALALLARQRRQGGVRRISTCAINLSGTSLGDDSLLEFVRAQLALQRVDPQRLCFEITETSAIAHLPNAVRMIKELRQLGCRFSLDDFGSGMSSFSYLKHLPVDYLKIDGSFVRDLPGDATSRAMVEVINHIGHVMGKHTIAEFAESMATVDALRAIGVDYAQGYAIARPVPFEQFLEAEPPRSAPSASRTPRPPLPPAPWSPRLSG